ncbi:MAG: hypothetical protein ACLQU1_27960 [Bryobacteraceae bacterium]
MNRAIPARVSGVVARALAKKPEDRFPNCKEFAQRLAESLSAAARVPRVNPVRVTVCDAIRTI